jgi:hypothetical protein
MLDEARIAVPARPSRLREEGLQMLTGNAVQDSEVRRIAAMPSSEAPDNQALSLSPQCAGNRPAALLSLASRAEDGCGKWDIWVVDTPVAVGFKTRREIKVSFGQK